MYGLYYGLYMDTSQPSEMYNPPEYFHHQAQAVGRKV